MNNDLRQQCGRIMSRMRVASAVKKDLLELHNALEEAWNIDL